MLRQFSVRRKINFLALTTAIGVGVLCLFILVNAVWLKNARDDALATQKIQQRANAIQISFLQARRFEETIHHTGSKEKVIRHSQMVEETLTGVLELLALRQEDASFQGRLASVQGNLDLYTQTFEEFILHFNEVGDPDSGVLTRLENAYLTTNPQVRKTLDRDFVAVWEEMRRAEGAFVKSKVQLHADQFEKVYQRFDRLRRQLWLSLDEKESLSLGAQTYSRTFEELVGISGKIKTLTKRLDVAFNDSISVLETLRKEAERQAATASMIFSERWQTTVWITFMSSGFIMLSVSVFGLNIGSSLSRRIGEMTSAMTALERGNTGITIPSIEHTDEIGEMARSVSVFRKNAEDLKKYQEHLEELVSERTADLEEIQRQLEQQRNLLQAVLDGIDQGIVAFDDNLKLVAWNRHFLEVRDYPPDLVTEGRSFEDFMRYDVEHNEFGQSDPEKEIQFQIVRARKFLPHHFERQRPNGSFIEVWGGPIPGGGFVSTYTDISQRKIWEKNIAETKEVAEAANVKLRELDKLKSMFIASMSHELRTPLNSIIGFTGLVLEGVEGDINDKQRDDLTRVKKAGRHLLELITDVIDVSKIETGRLEVFPETINLGEFLEEAVKTIETEAVKKELSIEVDAPRDLEMYTDRKRLLQCLLNYLSNAVKYSETGTVRVSVQEVDGIIEISVSDTGIGIAEEDMPRLFDAFERMESHLRVKAGGAGLGLYLTRKIAMEMLGGDVSAESQLGKGSTFRLKVLKTLPDKKSEGDEKEVVES